MTKAEILKRYETFVAYNTEPIFLKENVLLAMEEYAHQERKIAKIFLKIRQ